MVYLLAHCLSAMALQSVFNPFLGLNYLSVTSFMSGIVSMLVHLDRDSYNGKRTPLLHSVLFGVIWSLLAALFLCLVSMSELMTQIQLLPLATVFPTAFASHLLADAMTEEGIYLMPRTLHISRWFQRKYDPDNSWANWKTATLPGKRRNDDPILNFCVSFVSLVVLIVLLALTPL
ncbi:MAG: hypothetical protein JSV43_00645 [Methanobacteriota archaeon]|nr:MAG: hypothetical protein JSV43_00645 [Euryarchaeota archaeon]